MGLDWSLFKTTVSFNVAVLLTRQSVQKSSTFKDVDCVIVVVFNLESQQSCPSNNNTQSVESAIHNPPNK